MNKAITKNIHEKRKYKSSGIASWAKEERPRERLLNQGPQALTDAELLAILLRVGIKGLNAVEFGRQLLAKFGSLRGMLKSPFYTLLQIKGIKSAKAAQLAAAMEIARRISFPDVQEHAKISSTQKATEYLRGRLQGLSDEHFHVLYLNSHKKLLEDVLIAKGTVDSVTPPIRTIVIHALQLNASGIIAGHNHPSGEIEPSESDRLLTKDLIAACHPLNLTVLDSIIIGTDKTYSFADSGLLDELALESMAPLPRKAKASIIL